MYIIYYSSFALFDTLVVYTIIVLFDAKDLILYTNLFHFYLFWDHWPNSYFDTKYNLLARM